MAIVGCSKDEPTVSKEQLLSRANEAFAAERLVEAEKGYREVLRVQPDNSEAQRQLGIIYFTQGQVRQAFPFLKKSLELQPDNVDVQLKLALIYNAGRDFQKARDLARQILEKNPGDQEALLLMVYTADTPDALQEARNIVDKLKGQADDQATYHLALGAIELRQKDDTRAEAEFKAALDLAPKSAAINAALGNFYLSKQDLTAATQAYKTAATLSPPRSPIRVRYADLLLRTGAAAEAKKLVEDDARNAPDYLPNQVFLMKIACAEKRDDDCAARVEKILAQDSFNYDALFESGISSLRKGDATRAIRIFEQLSGMTQDARPRFQLALAYLLYAKGATAAEAQKAVDVCSEPADGSCKRRSAIRPGHHVARRNQDQNRQCRCSGRFIVALDQGATSNCPSPLPARNCISRSPPERSGASGLPKDGGIVPEGSSTVLPGRSASSRERSTAGGARGVREIDRDFRGLPAAGGSACKP